MTRTSVLARIAEPRALLRRRIVPLVLLGAFAGLIWANRVDLPVAASSLRHANLAWFAVAAAGSLAMLVNLAGLHRATQSMVGIQRGWKSSLGLAFGIYFLNQVAKSGGMAGSVLIVSEARREGQSPGAATAGYVIATVLNQLGFSLALTVGLAIAAQQHRLSRIDCIAAVAFAFLTLGFATSLLAAIRSQAATRKVFNLPCAFLRCLVKARARLLSQRNCPTSPGPVDRGLMSNQRADDFFAAMQILKRNPIRVVRPLCHALLSECIGVCILWASLASLGVKSAIAVPLVGYTISILFSIVGFLPGGLGIVELSLAGALVSMGITVGKAAAAVAIFRIFELWLPASIGAPCAAHFRKMNFQETHEDLQTD